VEKVKAFSGDPSQLAACDRFFLDLIRLPDHPNLVTALLLKEDFKPMATSFETSLRNYIRVCEAILNSSALKSFFRRVLTIGNYINSGSYAGNAAGFRLKDLCKLVELRSCVGSNGMGAHLSLLDFVVKGALEKDPGTLFFVEELAGIEQAHRLDFDSIQKAVSEFETNLRNVKSLLAEKELPLLRKQVGQFISESENDVQRLKTHIKEIIELSTKMARWFCENPRTFNLSDCLHLFCKLCQDVTAAKQTVQKVMK
ncbi:hypothetical protein BIW11_08985, partial [Tropilaelaps mercedesae]